MLEEQVAPEESFPTNGEEDRTRVTKVGSGTDANDVEAFASSAVEISSTCNKEIIYVSSDDKEK
jgi:hypothetical protein